ncbi:MAG TPA: ribosome recycling factor [Candidatus Krumholzibacteria bacterium]|nr:ribosome recycling factor [Candidatus Krumholzibacteria bacterium]HRX50190.1 ribosome recycling factor [Candidatus Krumholzibacteria bacterium]
MSHELVQEAEMEMEEAVQALARRVAKIRTGKATPALLDPVRVEYYGSPTPLKQLANIGVPEPRLLTVAPFDRSTLNDIERAIMAAGLGLNPSNDGNVIRVPIPELTEERRREMSKNAREFGEQGKVAVRKARQSANDAIKKADDMTEDEARAAKDEVQKLTDRFCDDIDKLVKEKEAEIMEI